MPMQEASRIRLGISSFAAVRHPLVESLRLCAEAGGAAGLEVYLENMPAVAQFEGGPRSGHSYGVAYDELRHIFGAVGHPSLRLCLGLGHAFLSGRSTLEALLADEDVSLEACAGSLARVGAWMCRP